MNRNRKTLNDRFAKNMGRHPTTERDSVQAKLEAQPEKVRALHEMERTGGEPDVVGYAEQTSESICCDCSRETPSRRRSLCYDREALLTKKK
ncbi:MAG TPA: DUF4256 domain-containing protein [Telluria sp.]